MTRRGGRGKTAPTARERTRRAGKGQRPSPQLQRLRPPARRPARVHRARRERRRDRAHQGRGLEARNGHAGRDREPRAAGAAGDPVRGRAGLSQGHAAPVRRDQFIQAARDHARTAGAQGPARRGARLSRPHEDPPADRAEDGGERAGVRERRPRRQGRRAEIPGAVPARARRRPLHRHRRSRDHARPRGQLGQLRHLSRHGAGQEPRLGVDFARQAWAADPREVFPRRQALPGADLLRARPAAVPRRRQRAASSGCPNTIMPAAIAASRTRSC